MTDHAQPPRARVKRAADVVLAACGLVVLAPLLLAIAVAIKVTSGGPVLFRQQRPGLHGRAFTILKFRSMTAATAADGELLPETQRLTRMGYWLRRSSLDEIPELWNVLVGDMSLIGPRPLLMRYLPLYSPEQMRRHEVRPGITGLAQVKGRHTLAWQERFRLDTWYVDHWSLRLDAWILRETFAVLLRGQAQPGDGAGGVPFTWPGNGGGRDPSETGPGLAGDTGPG